MDNLPDVEELVIQWLTTIPELGAFGVAGDKPTNGATQFVTVDRTGGAREAMVLDRAEILIEVYSKESRVVAKNTAGLIADRIQSLVDSSEDITGARINSVVNLDDVLGGFHRYQIYVDVNHRRRF